MEVCTDEILVTILGRIRSRLKYLRDFQDLGWRMMMYGSFDGYFPGWPKIQDSALQVLLMKTTLFVGDCFVPGIT